MITVSMKEQFYLNLKQKISINGGFQLEIESISRVINHMTCYKFRIVNWLKLQHSDWRANLVKNFFNVNFTPMKALKFITGHVTFRLCYNQI